MCLGIMQDSPVKLDDPDQHRTYLSVRSAQHPQLLRPFTDHCRAHVPILDDTALPSTLVKNLAHRCIENKSVLSGLVAFPCGDPHHPHIGVQTRAARIFGLENYWLKHCYEQIKDASRF